MDALDNSATRNKLAARLIKAEMLGDSETIERLKGELAELGGGTSSKIQTATGSPTTSNAANHARQQDSGQSRSRPDHQKRPQHQTDRSTPSNRSTAKRVHEDDMTIHEMYLQQKTGSVQDEIKLYLTNSKKFAKDSQDTEQFSEELDDSQLLLKGKPSKSKTARGELVRQINMNKEFQECSNCPQSKLKHMTIWQTDYIYANLLPFKLGLSRLSTVVIRNLDHDSRCFIESDDECQRQTEKLISCLRSFWDQQNYQCIVMESYYKNFDNHRNNLLPCSGGNHFQLYCIPIRKKYFEEARICFKQSILECEKEWTMNKKLVTATEDKKIQNCLPKGLSYFWVCFDSLNKGFGHVIENEENFSRYFGLDVLAGLLDKNIHEILHPRKEDYNEQFERARQFKLQWSQFRPD